jgi:hypothetical protein
MNAKSRGSSPGVAWISIIHRWSQITEANEKVSSPQEFGIRFTPRAADNARTRTEHRPAEISLTHPESLHSQAFCYQSYPLIPGHLANLVRGPEKAGAGSSIPFLTRTAHTPIAGTNRQSARRERQLLRLAERLGTLLDSSTQSER